MTQSFLSPLNTPGKSKVSLTIPPNIPAPDSGAGKSVIAPGMGVFAQVRILCPMPKRKIHAVIYGRKTNTKLSKIHSFPSKAPPRTQAAVITFMRTQFYPAAESKTPGWSRQACQTVCAARDTAGKQFTDSPAAVPRRLTDLDNWWTFMELLIVIFDILNDRPMIFIQRADIIFACQFLRQFSGPFGHIDQKSVRIFITQITFCRINHSNLQLTDF